MDVPVQPKKSSTSRIIAIVCLVVGTPLAVFVLWGMMAGFEADVLPSDRARVLTVADLELTDHEIDASKETLTRRRYLDGSWDVEYEYDADAVYVWSLVGKEPTEKDARAVYTGQKAFTGLGVGVEEGTELVDKPSAFSWGDAHASKVLVVDGEEAGNFVIARKGKYVFSVAVSGVLWGNEEDLEEVLVDAFERAMSLD